MFKRSLFVALVLAGALPQALAYAKDAPPPAFFGATLGVDVSANTQVLPAVAWNEVCDRFLVADQSLANGVDNNIWGRYVSGNGLGLVGAPFQMTANAAEQQAPSDASVPMAGKYVVVWMDKRAGNWDIYARIWDCYKQPLTGEIQITIDPSHQMVPDVVCGYDLCWIVWQDFRTGNWDIYGQRLDPFGALIGGNMALTVDPTSQTVPAIAYNPNPTGCGAHSFLAVWQDARNVAAGLGTDIYDQQLDNFGLCGGNIAAYTGAATQSVPDVAFGTIDNFYQVVWADFRAGNYDIYSVGTNPAGVPVGASFALSAAGSTQTNPAIAFDDDRDQFLTVWQDFRAANWDVYGQRNTGLGALIGANFAISAGAGTERNPAVAYGSIAMHYFVAWDDTIDIYGRAYWP